MSTRKQSLSSNILMIGLFTLLAVGSWVVFDVYRAVVKTTVPEVVQVQIEPLDSEIDPSLITFLRASRKFDQNFLNTLTPKFLLEESAQTGEVILPTDVQPTPEATESAEPSI